MRDQDITKVLRRCSNPFMGVPATDALANPFSPKVKLVSSYEWRDKSEHKNEQ